MAPLATLHVRDTKQRIYNNTMKKKSIDTLAAVQEFPNKGVATPAKLLLLSPATAALAVAKADSTPTAITTGVPAAINNKFDWI